MIVESMKTLSENSRDFSCRENCAEAVKIAVNLCNLADKELFNNSCTMTRNNLLQSNYWKVVKNPFNCQRNDIIFFDWDNSGDCDHVGIVTEVSAGVIYYINFNGTIPHKRSVDTIVSGSRKIASIFRYCENITTNNAITYNEPRMDIIQKGHKGAIVKLIQAVVKVKTDGFFGNNTEKAVKEFQKNNNCEIDGQVGNETLTAMSHTIF